MKNRLKIIPFLVAFLLFNLNVCYAQHKSPIEVVQFFNKSYGGPLMDEIAEYTTPKFRDNKPKSVWVVVAAAKNYIIHKDPQSYVIEKLKSYDIVFLGTRHKKKTILKFVSGLIPHLHKIGTTHLGLEICSDQQDKIDSFLQTGNGLNEIKIHPQIDCAEYRSLFTTIRSVYKSKRLTVIALDLPKSIYQVKINRDEWMARSIAKIFHQNSNAKVFVVVGNLHILKKIEWKDQVSNPHGFIRSYLKGLMSHCSMFSIGQLIDESPKECDFTGAFSHLEGSVAMDCDRRFTGWRIGIMAPVAAKPTEVCELLDGVIVY